MLKYFWTTTYILRKLKDFRNDLGQPHRNKRMNLVVGAILYGCPKSLQIFLKNISLELNIEVDKCEKN